ncbi:hypothetical protein DdX_19114 [Ditylenchus destructor]|uniref:Uncharacterized protein n=1 Tax=Ditylenchus destructor TaxID=166010 RepID=A0AAD4MJF5_9BILA|nr:hypothetical protein DdX_19114 [Ditylenchus destructor]
MIKTFIFVAVVLVGLSSGHTKCQREKCHFDSLPIKCCKGVPINDACKNWEEQRNCSLEKCHHFLGEPGDDLAKCLAKCPGASHSPGSNISFYLLFLLAAILLVINLR